VLYVAKHFGVPSALKILIASLIVEFWARLGWSLVNFSGKNFIETLRAYRMFARALPQLLNDIRSE
jgi:hypothetical protein